MGQAEETTPPPPPAAPAAPPPPAAPAAPAAVASEPTLPISRRTVPLVLLTVVVTLAVVTLFSKGKPSASSVSDGNIIANAPEAEDATELPVVQYPTLPATGAVPGAFVPARWSIEREERGDLNRDGRADVLLVLRMQDRANIIDNDGSGTNSLNTNPRMLAILFADGAGYRLEAQNQTLVPRQENPDLNDYLEGVSVRRGAFTVSLGVFASAGTYWVSNSTFVFRYQDGCFRVIGFERLDFNRATHESSKMSLNFSTSMGEFERVEGDDALTTTQTMDIPRRPLTCLNDVGDGLSFDPGVISPI